MSVREDFGEATEAFVAFVRTVPREQLDAPATSEWTVAELVGHAARAFVATEAVLQNPLDPSSRALTGPADYYRAAMSMSVIHNGITQRARAAGAALQGDPYGTVRADADRVAPLVDATPLEREVQHAAGRIAFADYLATRVAELALHTVDLQLALGVAPSFPDGPAQRTRDLMVELLDRADPLAVACVLTGRRMPEGRDVLR